MGVTRVDVQSLEIFCQHIFGWLYVPTIGCWLCPAKHVPGGYLCGSRDCGGLLRAYVASTYAETCLSHAVVVLRC